MRLSAAAAVLCLFVASPCVLAQTQSSPTVVKDATASAIAQKALSAMGGGPNTYQDSIAKGSLTYHADAGDLTVLITLKSKGSEKLRWEIQNSSGTDVEVSDGLNGCAIRDARRRSPISSVDIASRRVDHIPALSLLAEYADPNINIQYGGTSAVNGAIADVVALSFQITALPKDYDSLKLTQHLYFVDRASGLVLKVQSVVDIAPGYSETFENYFTDYRSVNGILVPYQRSTYRSGKKIWDVSLSSVIFNTGLTDTDFDASCGGGQ